MMLCFQPKTEEINKIIFIKTITKLMVYLNKLNAGGVYKNICNKIELTIKEGILYVKQKPWSKD